MTPTSFQWIHVHDSLTYYLSEKAGLNFINYFFLWRSFFVLFLFLTIGCSVPPLRWHSKIRKYLSMDLKAYQKEYRNVAKTSCTWIIYSLCTRRSEKQRHSLSFFEPFHLPKKKYHNSRRGFLVFHRKIELSWIISLQSERLKPGKLCYMLTWGHLETKYRRARQERISRRGIIMRLHAAVIQGTTTGRADMASELKGITRKVI